LLAAVWRDPVGAPLPQQHGLLLLFHVFAALVLGCSACTGLGVLLVVVVVVVVEGLQWLALLICISGRLQRQGPSSRQGVYARCLIVARCLIRQLLGRAALFAWQAPFLAAAAICTQ